MGEVFEPVTTKQVESNEKQLQAIDKQTQGVTQAIGNQTRAIEHNNNTLQNSIKEGIKQYNEITNHNNQLLTSLANSNQNDSSIVKTVSNLLNDKKKSQFSLEPITQSFAIAKHKTTRATAFAAPQIYSQLIPITHNKF